jgi:hypothetical protein
MPVITLRQPWAALVALGHKTIETRSHNRFKCLVGKRIAIHAGQGYDRAGKDVAAQHMTQRQLSALDSGAIIATAYVSDARDLHARDERQALIECSTPRFGLILTNIQRIKPIAAKGKLGIWYPSRQYA